MSDYSLDRKDPALKIVLIGSQAVGKSALLERLVDNKHARYHITTIGVDFKAKREKVENEKYVQLQFWDPSGDPKYKSIALAYYKGTNVFCLTFDPFDSKTFEFAKLQLEVLKRTMGDANPKIFLVATKMDRADTIDTEWRVKESEAQEFASTNGLEYIETSAKTGLNVDILCSKFVSAYKQISEAISSSQNSKSDSSRKTSTLSPTKSASEALSKLNTLHIRSTNAKTRKALSTIIEYLKKGHGAADIEKWKNHGEGKKALKTLQGTSYFKTVQNIITCFIAGVFYPLAYKLFENNLKKHGKSSLFWTDGDKQTAEQAVELEINKQPPKSGK
jgi:small GTP-binding protein